MNEQEIKENTALIRSEFNDIVFGFADWVSDIDRSLKLMDHKMNYCPFFGDIICQVPLRYIKAK